VITRCVSLNSTYLATAQLLVTKKRYNDIQHSFENTMDAQNG